jgi:hypothetical protein
MEKPGTIAISTDGVRAKVECNGVDLTDMLSGISYQHEAQEAPVLYLKVRTGVSIEIDGEAFVRVLETQTTEAALLEFLAGVDPQALEDAALADGRAFGEAALAELMRRAGYHA